jgi:hypothetical protein
MTAQDEFDATYITSSEICAELKITRATIIMGRKRGMLPDAIEVRRPGGEPQLVLWRREKVRPFLDAWKLTLQARRGELVQEEAAVA